MRVTGGENRADQAGLVAALPLRGLVVRGAGFASAGASGSAAMVCAGWSAGSGSSAAAGVSVTGVGVAGEEPPGHLVELDPVAGDHRLGEAPGAVADVEDLRAGVRLLLRGELITSHLPHGLLGKHRLATAQQHPGEGEQVVDRGDEPGGAVLERRWAAPLPAGGVPDI